MRLPSLLFFILLTGASQSFATTLSVNISTTAFAPYIFHNDSFSLDAYSGTVLLDSTAPVSATINQANFLVALWPEWPGYDITGLDQAAIDAISVDQLFNLGRILTIGSVSQNVSQQAAFHLTYIADDITGYVSAPTTFNLGSDGTVDVTLDAFLNNEQIPNTYNFNVTATFAWTPPAAPTNPSVPEPGTLALMGIALTGLALIKRRRIP